LAEGVAFADRAGTGVGAVRGQFRLVDQVVVPLDVAGVVSGDEDLPLVHRQPGGAGVDAAVGVDPAAGGVPAEHVGAGVAGVVQDADHPGVVELAPAQLPGPGAAVGAQREPASGERRDHPVGGSGRGERGEHVGHRGRDLLIGVDDGGAVLVVQVADRKRAAELTAGGGGAFRALQPAGEQVQLGLAHGAFQSEQQPVVEVGQVIDAVTVDQQRVGEAGQFQQPGQIGRGTGQPGDLQPEDGADLAQADPRHQSTEPVAALG
jgi:hypothetical protein